MSTVVGLLRLLGPVEGEPRATVPWHSGFHGFEMPGDAYAFMRKLADCAIADGKTAEWFLAHRHCCLESYEPHTGEWLAARALLCAVELGMLPSEAS